jgi:hypothetical protein
MPVAFPVLYLYLLDAARSSSMLTTNRCCKTHTTPAESSTLQNLEQRAELGYRRMQRSVTRLFFVGAYVHYPSVLDTSGTFININPFESELFNLRADNNVVCQFPFLFFYSYLWLGRGLDVVGEDNMGLKLVPMRRLRVLRTRRARPCTLATLAPLGSARS